MLLTRLMRQITLRHARHALATLEETQFLPLERIRSLQRGRLQALLKHAFSNVPYYRDVAAARGLRAEDFATLQDLEKLPVLTKEIIRRESSRMLAENAAAADRIPNATGGSTGEPLHFFQDRHFETWADAARIRGWYHLAGSNCWDPCAVLWGAAHEVQEDFSPLERVRDYVGTGEILLNAFNLSDARMAAFQKLCRRLRPTLLRGYFTAVDEFARFLRKTKSGFPPLRGVILCAETVDEVKRAEIEETFRAPAFNLYGGRELSLIAMECQHKRGLHEVSENNYVEFEPIELQGCPGAGNLLVTNLNNYVMPFIRYRIGDIGVSGAAETCACGRGLPLIKRVIGRSTEVLAFRDGVKIAGEMFIHLMKDFPVRDYQFVQRSDSLVTLRYPKAASLDVALRERIVDTYRGYLPPGTVLAFEEVECIPKTPTGKFRFVMREPLDGDGR